MKSLEINVKIFHSGKRNRGTDQEAQDPLLQSNEGTEQEKRLKQENDDLKRKNQNFHDEIKRKEREKGELNKQVSEIKTKVKDLKKHFEQHSQSFPGIEIVESELDIDQIFSDIKDMVKRDKKELDNDSLMTLSIERLKQQTSQIKDLTLESTKKDKEIEELNKRNEQDKNHLLGKDEQIEDINKKMEKILLENENLKKQMEISRFSETVNTEKGKRPVRKKDRMSVTGDSVRRELVINMVPPPNQVRELHSRIMKGESWD